MRTSRPETQPRPGKQNAAPVELPVYSLDQLLIGVTPDTMREAFDWGPDKGREKVKLPENLPVAGEIRTSHVRSIDTLARTIHFPAHAHLRAPSPK